MKFLGRALIVRSVGKRKRERLFGADAQTGRGSLKGINSHHLKLNDEVIAQYVEKLRVGVPYDTVSDILGFGRAHARKWLRLGEMYEDNDGKPEEYIIYAAHLQATRQAAALYFEQLILDMNYTIEPTEGSARKASILYRRSLEILARRDREHWAKVEPEAHQGEDYSPDMKYL